jgi:hypothetical protein
LLSSSWDGLWSIGFAGKGVRRAFAFRRVAPLQNCPRKPLFRGSSAAAPCLERMQSLEQKRLGRMLKNHQPCLILRQAQDEVKSFQQVNLVVRLS